MDSVPLIRIEKGHATAEELAALTVVLMARAAAAAAVEAPAPPRRTHGRRPPNWHRLGSRTAYRGPRGRHIADAPGSVPSAV